MTGQGDIPPEMQTALRRMLLYAEFDHAGSVAEMNARGNAKSREMNAWGATRLGHMAMQRMDAVQDVFNTNLTAGIYGGTATGLTTRSGASGPYSVWLTPVYSYTKHDAKNNGFSDTDGYFAGVSFGVAKQFEIGTLGIGGHYLTGNEEGGGYDVDSDTFGLTAGYRSNPLLNGAFSPWLQANFSYAYTDFDQKRKASDGRYKASVDQHAIRQTQAGVHPKILAQEIGRAHV